MEKSLSSIPEKERPRRLAQVKKSWTDHLKKAHEGNDRVIGYCAKCDSFQDAMDKMLKPLN